HSVEVRWRLAPLDPAAEQTAEYAPEVLMSREREEAPRIREHADEAREKAEARERAELKLHAVDMVVVPPGRSELHLTRDRPVLEAADNAGHDLVVVGIERVQYSPGQQAIPLQRVEEGRERRGRHRIVDGVIARIRAQRREGLGVEIAHRGQMELHRPASPGVHPPDLEKK